MSLEAAIQDTNTLLRELIAKIAAPAAAPAVPPKAAPTRGRASSDDPPAPAATPTPASPAPTAGSQAPSYTEMSKAVTTLCLTGGRAKAEAIISSFENKDKPGEKCTNGKQLKPSDYLAVIEACAKASVA